MIVKEEDYQTLMASLAGTISKYMLVVWVVSALFYNISNVGHEPNYSKLLYDVADSTRIALFTGNYEDRIQKTSKLLDLDDIQMSSCKLDNLHYPTIKEVKNGAESCFNSIHIYHKNEVQNRFSETAESEVKQLLGDLRKLITNADILNNLALRNGYDANTQLDFFIQRHLEKQYTPAPIADLFGFKIDRSPYLYLSTLLITVTLLLQERFKKLNRFWSNEWTLTCQSEVFSESRLLTFLYFKLVLIYAASMAVVLPIIHNFYYPRKVYITAPPGIDIEKYYYQADIWSYIEVALGVISLVFMSKLFNSMKELQKKIRTA